MDTYGRAMRTARNKNHLTQQELSDLSGISRSTIDAYENDRRNPSLLNVVALADTLNMSIDEYIGFIPRKDA